ncbi:hypothetical protein ACFPRL_20080 [Pseudoclavibacter helvolus]
MPCLDSTAPMPASVFQPIPHSGRVSATRIAAPAYAESARTGMPVASEVACAQVGDGSSATGTFQMP